MSWQVQEAKQRFSALVKEARANGPQIITKRGDEVAVMVSIDEFRELTGARRGFKEALLAGPDLSQLVIHRDSEPARTVEL